MNKNTYTKGDIKEAYNLENYYKKIPNYDTITTLPEENLNYIKEALPNVTSTAWMLGNIKDIDTGESTGCTKLIGDKEGTTIGTEAGGSGVTSGYVFDFRNIDMRNITNAQGMFVNCRNLYSSQIQTITDLSGKNKISYGATFYFGYGFSPKNASYMFSDCFNYAFLIQGLSIVGTTINSSISIIGLDTSLITDMSYMFYDSFKCSALDIMQTNIKYTVNLYFANYLDMKSCTNYKNMFSRPKLALHTNGAGCAGYGNKIQIKNPPQLYYDDKTAFETEIGLKDGEYEIVS